MGRAIPVFRDDCSRLSGRTRPCGFDTGEEKGDLVSNLRPLQPDKQLVSGQQIFMMYDQEARSYMFLPATVRSVAGEYFDVLRENGQPEGRPTCSCKCIPESALPLNSSQSGCVAELRTPQGAGVLHGRGPARGRYTVQGERSRAGPVERLLLVSRDGHVDHQGRHPDPLRRRRSRLRDRKARVALVLRGGGSRGLRPGRRRKPGFDGMFRPSSRVWPARCWTSSSRRAIIRRADRCLACRSTGHASGGCPRELGR